MGAIHREQGRGCAERSLDLISESGRNGGAGDTDVRRYATDVHRHHGDTFACLGFADLTRHEIGVGKNGVTGCDWAHGRCGQRDSNRRR